MRKIIYYVAISIDGFMAGPRDEIDMFERESPAVDYYLNDLKNFDTVIMGRRTYEFGYQYGLQPGQPAYSHMRHYIFSDSLQFERAHKLVKVVPGTDLEKIDDLRNEAGTPIYLCGGGQFAGWLLDHEKIDLLKIKLNPILLGSGIPLFGASRKSAFLDLQESIAFPCGLKFLTYSLKYSK